MVKYNSICKLCGYEINIGVEAENMQDFMLNISSDCPSISLVSENIIKVDAMKEAVSKPSDSELKKQITQLCDKPDCTIYKSIREAVENHLGWYHQIGTI